MQAGMPKTFEEALSATVAKQSKPPAEIVSLNLDSSCRATAVEVRSALGSVRSYAHSMECCLSLPSAARPAAACCRLLPQLPHTHCCSAGAASAL